VAGGAGDAARPAFQRDNPVGEGRNGGVRQAGVDVADFLQVEELGGVVGVAEDVGGGLVDRHLPGAGRGVWISAGMDGERVESEGAVGHGVLLCLIVRVGEDGRHGNGELSTLDKTVRQ